MKKSVIIAALAVAAFATPSFGQGSIGFNSYLANSSAGILTHFSAALGGGLVGAGYTADLLYSLSPISDTAGNGSLNVGWSFSGSGGASLFNVATTFGTSGNTLGYFQSPNVFALNPYTAGTTIYFEVIAYQTAAGSYAASTIRGHSDSFSTTLNTGIGTPPPASFTPFTVATVPEPTTLALAGLGGLAALVAFRRKQV